MLKIQQVLHCLQPFSLTGPLLALDAFPARWQVGASAPWLPPGAARARFWSTFGGKMVKLTGLALTIVVNVLNFFLDEARRKRPRISFSYYSKRAAKATGLSLRTILRVKKSNGKDSSKTRIR